MPNQSINLTAGTLAALTRYFLWRGQVMLNVGFESTYNEDRDYS